VVREKHPGTVDDDTRIIIKRVDESPHTHTSFRNPFSALPAPRTPVFFERDRRFRKRNPRGPEGT